MPPPLYSPTFTAELYPKVEVPIVGIPPSPPPHCHQRWGTIPPPTDTNDGALFLPPLTPMMGHYSSPH
ncbi:unnamed protein product [Staurois parvus]|uniref:Uncharacterized protein n=1 Tax=Staurois parvus TaxID=386267 RepID=A0ABN9ARY6_9NEOB|nr:unnamed protein product [Staurois parvus]